MTAKKIILHPVSYSQPRFPLFLIFFSSQFVKNVGRLNFLGAHLLYIFLLIWDRHCFSCRYLRTWRSRTNHAPIIMGAPNHWPTALRGAPLSPPSRGHCRGAGGDGGKGKGREGRERCHLAPYRPDIPRVFVLAADCFAGRRVGALDGTWHIARAQTPRGPINIPINSQNPQIKKGAHNGSMWLIADGAETWIRSTFTTSFPPPPPIGPFDPSGPPNRCGGPDSVCLRTRRGQI